MTHGRLYFCLSLTLRDSHDSPLNVLSKRATDDLTEQKAAAQTFIAAWFLSRLTLEFFLQCKGHCYTFALVSLLPSLQLSPSVSALPSSPPLLCACDPALSPSPLLSVFCLHLHSPAFLSSLPPSTKSAGHQSNVVSEPPEVHSLLHLAQLPLADPQGPGADAAAAHAGPLPLLHSWLPGQEDTGGMMCW